MSAIGAVTIDGSLGSGSTGTVYLARDPGNGEQRVALKRVPLVAEPAIIQRLRHEAEILSSLRHPNIVRVFDLVADDSGFTMTMEYAAGGSLAGRLQDVGRLAPEELVAVLAPVADAVQAAHDHGVLHLDIKPPNILLTDDGRPLLADFGVARRVSRPTFLGGSVVGTAEYLDPAVAGGSPPTEQSDIYGLGICAFEALAGRPPFEASNPLAVLRAAAEGVRPTLAEAAPGVPSALAAVVERAIAVDPADRFSTARELADALRASVTGSPTAAGTVGPARGLATTLDFGPRPLAGGGDRLVRPAPDRTRAEGTGWRVPASVVIAAAVAIVVVASGAAVVWGRHRAGKPAGPSPAAAIGNRPICPAISSLPTADRSAAGEVLAGVGDDGCPIEVVWSGGEVTVRRPSAGGVEQPVKYQLGEPGDQAVLGDWDCDGSTTLGVYRPDTGAAFVFDGWPSPDQPVTARPVASGPAIRDGRAEVVHPGGAGSGRCDELVVRPR